MESERLRALLEADPEKAEKFLSNLASKIIIPHAGGQQQVLDAQQRFQILNAGRRWGKTIIGSKKALRTARKPKRVIWWVAPSYKVVKRGYAEVLRQLPDGVLSKPAPPESTFDAGRAAILRFKNGSKMEFYSAERPEGMLGEGVDYVILDEAATMSRNVWEQIVRPTLADRQGQALFISTPRGRNWFYQLYNMGQDELEKDFASWTFPSWTNPTIPKEEWDELERTLPAAVYEQEVAAMFISNAASVFRFGEDRIKPVTQPLGHVFLGVDLAKHRDFTVFDGVRSCDRMPCYHERFNAVSWPEQRARLHRAITKLKNGGAVGVTVVIDSTGIGDPFVDDLEAEGLDVVPIKFTNQWKQQSVMLLSSDLEQGNAFIHDAQRSEFEAYSYEITDAGRWKFQAPQGGHDDEVSAKLLQHWGLASLGVPNVRSLGTVENETKQDTVVTTEVELANPATSMWDERMWN